jgi:DNA-binding winged helix-turn-helix (wHTH) protein/tetratricopeptide (TPR) repeat protein
MIHLPTAVIDLEKLTARRGGELHHLTPQEGRLLAYLAGRNGQTATKEELQAEVFGYAPGVFTRTVDSTLSRLRQKIEPDPKRPRSLLTIRGKGLQLTLMSRTSADASAGHLGRAALLQAVHEAVDAGGVTQLSGPGGAGKTTLARVALQARRHRFIDVSAARTVGEVATVVLAAFEIRAPSDSGTLARGVASMMPEDHVLVLDNLEQVDDEGQAWLRTLVEAVSGPVLCTSRTVVWEDLPSIPVGPVDADAAIEILQAAAHRASPFAPLPDPREALEALARSVDCLPLALEIVGSKLPLMRAEALRERLDALVRIDDGSGRRQGSLASMVSWSWSLLRPESCNVAAWWSVFPGGLHPEGLDAVAPAGAPPSLDVLDEIRRAGLVGRRGDRLAFWHVVHAFAGTQLTDDARRTAELAHAQWLLSEPRAEGWILAHRSDIAAAMERMKDAHPALTATLGWELNRVWRLLSAEDVAQVRRVTLQAAQRQDDPVVLAKALIAQASRSSTDPEGVDRAAALLVGCGEPSLLAMALRLSGNARRRGGDVVDAQQRYEQALVEGAGTSEAAAVHYDLGGLFRERGILEPAQHHLTQAAALHRAAGNQQGETGCLLSLASVHRLRGEYDDGLRLIRSAIELAEALGDPYVQAEASHNCSTLLYSTEGASPSTLTANEHTLSLARRVGGLSLLNLALGLRGLLMFSLQRFTEAEVDFRAAEAVACDYRLTGAAAVWRSHVAMLQHRAGHQEVAASLYQDSIRQMEAAGRSDQRDQTVFLLGLLRAQQGFAEEAEACFVKASGSLVRGGVQEHLGLLPMLAGYQALGNDLAAARIANRIDADFVRAQPLLRPTWMLCEATTAEPLGILKRPTFPSRDRRTS